MFGMTKKQFLKKSKSCLKDTGIELLLIRELFNQEIKGNVESDEAYHKLEKIRKNLEKIFFNYESLNPPSKCKSLQIKLMHTIITLQDVVVINLEYLLSFNENSSNLNEAKLKNSLEKLEEFREEFITQSQKVDLYLKQRK
jgi:hypothetical protein